MRCGVRLPGGAVRRLLLSIGLALALVAPAQSAPAAADQGWTIHRFDAQVTIQPDASIRVAESVDVDFASGVHGIDRYVPVMYDAPGAPGYERVYRLTVESATDAQGRSWPYTTSREDRNLRIRIGDPNRTVSGPLSYRLVYRVEGALNSFRDHDELYWDVNGGGWPVAIDAVTATVVLPGPGLLRIASYQGASGSREAAAGSAAVDRATFRATRPLAAGEQLTIVAALPKGMVAEPAPILQEKPAELGGTFVVNAGTIGSALLVLMAGLLGVAALLWFVGRDREYRTDPAVTGSTAARIRPLFGPPAAVSWESDPPYQLRPAELAMIVNERVGGSEAAATIVDLAVRGYLSIAQELNDWTLILRGRGVEGIRDYERDLLAGVFGRSGSVTLSDVRSRLPGILRSFRGALSRDAARYGWFAGNPRSTRFAWYAAGACAVAVGLLVALVLMALSAGFAGLAVIADTVALLVAARWMPRRTAWGRELLRRTLGFRHTLATADWVEQAIARPPATVAGYVPYAMALRLGSVWMRLVSSALPAVAAGWYSGEEVFAADSFAVCFSPSGPWWPDYIYLHGYGGPANYRDQGGASGYSAASGFDGGGAGGGGGGGGGSTW